MRKKIIAVMSAMLILGILAGCGSSADHADNAITDANSLVKANAAAQAAVDSFHLDGTMEMDAKMKSDMLPSILGSGLLSIPMEAKISLDSGPDSAHGTMDVSLSFPGQSQGSSLEVYSDLKNEKFYTKATDAGSWTESDQQFSMTDLTGGLSRLSSEVLSSGEFSAGSEEYILTLKAASLGSAVNELGLMSGLSSAGMELDHLEMTGGEIIYTFNKNTLLLESIKTEDVNVIAEASYQGMSASVDMDLNGEYGFSRYNKLKPSEYQIPDGVR